jgi:hypothetical protein
VAVVRPGPPGWGYQPFPHLYQGRRGPELGGVAVLVVVTVLAALAAPHARTVRGLVAGELAELPAIGRPGRAPATGDRAQAARAVAFALAQRGKSYRWCAQGPHAFDCSGLTWAAWRAAGVTIPRTAAASSPPSPGPGAGSSPATCSSTAAPARPAAMWRWSWAGVGWSKPWAAASQSAPPASALATWAPSGQEPADDRRLPGLPWLGRADGG